MRVITWNRSFRGVSNGDGAKDDFDSEEYETHATVLDKLLAWEKKLYEEVKVGVNVHSSCCSSLYYAFLRKNICIPILLIYDFDS